MRKHWEKIRVAMAGRIRYKVTRGGLLFTLAILIVGLAAVVSANNLLFLIVATMLATLLISGLVSRLCLAALELDFLVPEHVAARRVAEVLAQVRHHGVDHLGQQRRGGVVVQVDGLSGRVHTARHSRPGTHRFNRAREPAGLDALRLCLPSAQSLTGRQGGAWWGVCFQTPCRHAGKVATPLG